MRRAAVIPSQFAAVLSGAGAKADQRRLWNEMQAKSTCPEDPTGSSVRKAVAVAGRIMSNERIAILLRLCGTAAAILVATMPVFAQAVHVGGRGVEGCEYFAASRDEVEEQWILGFLSGYAVASGSDILKNTPHEKIFKEIERRCNLKLKARVFDIAKELAHEWRD